jgi:phosphomannomutase/phosphoglucomutase
MAQLITHCTFRDAIINTIDGLRVEYPLGWGLIRASNTSANLTMRFEADNDVELERIKKCFNHELKPFINHVDQYL